MSGSRRDQREAAEWFDDHPEDARARAKDIFRREIANQMALRSRGGSGWIEAWHWEGAIAEILDTSRDSALVTRASHHLRELIPHWILSQYQDPENVERLLDRFQQAVDRSIQELD